MKSALRHPARAGLLASRLVMIAVLGLSIACKDVPPAPPDNNDKNDDNVPPEVESATLSLVKNESGSLELAAVDDDGDALSYRIEQPPAHGDATIEALDDDRARLTYTPSAGFSGQDAIGFAVSDGIAEVEATVTVEVIDRPPLADAPSAVVRPSSADDGRVTVRLSATDPDGDTVTFQVASPPAHGTLSDFVAVDPEPGEAPDPLATTVEVSYAPEPGSEEDDQFSVVATDGTNTTAALTIEIDVNAAPTATAVTATTPRGAPVTLTLSGSDADDEALTFEIVDAPASGALGEITSTGDTTAEVVYTPSDDTRGTVTFTYLVRDELDASQAAEATVTIENGSPTLDAVAEQGVLAGGSVTVELAGADPEGDALTFRLVSAPDLGALGDITSTGPTTAEVTYTAPASGGQTTFVVDAFDGNSASPPVSVSVTIDGPPTATSAAVTLDEDVPANLVLRGEDPEGTALTFAIVDGPAQGTLGELQTDSPTQAYVLFTPAPELHGEDTLTYSVTDAAGLTATATLSLTIEPVEDPPTAQAATVHTNEDEPVVITLAGSDPDGDDLTFEISGGADYGTLGAVTDVQHADGTSTAHVTYTPPADYNVGDGGDEFAFWVSDGVFLQVDAPSMTARIDIIVDPVNDPPSFSPGGDLTVDEDAGLQSVAWASAIQAGPSNESAQTVSFEVTVTDNAALFETPPAIDADGTLTYTTAQDAYGAATVTVVAKDDGGTANGGEDTSAATTFTITVQPVDDDPPTATPITVVANEDEPVTITLTGADPDQQTLTFAISEAPSFGSLSAITQIDATTAEVTYTPDAEYHGTDLLRFTAFDGATTSEPADVTLTIRRTNDRPTVTLNGTLVTQPGAPEPDGITILIEDEPSQDLTFHFDDLEGLDEHGDARAPYYFHIGMLEWPTPQVREGDPPFESFKWTDFDPNGFAKDGLILRPNFETGVGGWIQFSSSIGVAHEILQNLTFHVYTPGEYVIEIVVIDNGFLGRCPEGVNPPDDGETFHPEDYRAKIGREGMLLLSDANRCIRETTAVLHFNNVTYAERRVRFVHEQP